MGAWMRCSRWLGGWATALLLAVAPVAQASPLFGLSSESGFRDNPVTLLFTGPIDASLFLGGTIRVTYQPSTLTFLGMLGVIWNFTPGSGAGDLKINLTPNMPGNTPPPPPSYFALEFLINPDAPFGDTHVFLSTGSIETGEQIDALLFEGTLEVEFVDLDAIRGTVTVLANNAVPISSTLALSLTGLMLLGLARRARPATRRYGFLPG